MESTVSKSGVVVVVVVVVPVLDSVAVVTTFGNGGGDTDDDDDDAGGCGGGCSSSCCCNSATSPAWESTMVVIPPCGAESGGNRTRVMRPGTPCSIKYRDTKVDINDDLPTPAVYIFCLFGPNKWTIKGKSRERERE